MNSLLMLKYFYVHILDIVAVSQSYSFNELDAWICTFVQHPIPESM